MPLKEYLYLHPDAKLTPDEMDLICRWVETELMKFEEDDKEK
jgi:hypothetical protein